MMRMPFVPVLDNPRPAQENLRTFSSPEVRPEGSSAAGVGSKTIRRMREHPRDDESLLLTLASFLAPTQIPLDLLRRGASARNRWGTSGDIESRDSRADPSLRSLLADSTRLLRALDKLCQSGAAMVTDNDSFKIDQHVSLEVQQHLSDKEVTSWKKQAMIVAYSALSWKYIEPSMPASKSFLPHLKFTLEGYGTDASDLSPDIKTDLLLTLAEAIRLPGMPWKRFAIAHARELYLNVEGPYVDACLRERESLVSRISAKQDQAVAVLGSPSAKSPDDDRRMHAAGGFMAIQNALNSMQVEELEEAKRRLNEWEPVSEQPSPMEQVVLFRKHSLLGKALRYEGRFAEAEHQLLTAQGIADRYKSELNFDEDTRDLASNYADTLRELEQLDKTEEYLRLRIQEADLATRSSLEVSLAECLFARGVEAQRLTSEHSALDAARELCVGLQSRTSLLKYERLRVHITLAKTCFVQHDYQEALDLFSTSMREMGFFARTNGFATRALIRSMVHTLNHLDSGKGNEDSALMHVKQQSLDQLASLEKLAAPGAMLHWIPGLRKWETYLEREDGGPKGVVTRSRM